MAITKNPTLENVDFSNPGELDEFLNEVMSEGLRSVRAEGEQLRANGLMDSNGNILAPEQPPDILEGSERDFGG